MDNKKISKIDFEDFDEEFFVEENKEEKLTKNISMPGAVSVNDKLGVTQEYNRNLYDNHRTIKARNDFRDRCFDDNSTYYDKISGNTLHKDTKAAQRKYHMKDSDGNKISTKWARHVSETDHVNALKDIHDIAKKNPFLTDNDLKEIGNVDENFRLLSKSMNASKQASSDWDLILNDPNISFEGKVELAKGKIKSDATLHKKFAKRTAENVTGEFLAGAKESVVNASVSISIMAADQIAKVVKGEIEKTEAIKNISKTTTEVAAIGGTQRIVKDVVNTVAKNSNSQLINTVAKNNSVTQIMTVAFMVKDSAIKYATGEISEKEFLIETTEQGKQMVVGLAGSEVGGDIGGIVGAIVGNMIVPGAGVPAGFIVGEAIGKCVGAIIASVAYGSLVSIIDEGKVIEEAKNQIDNRIKEAIKCLEVMNNELVRLSEEKLSEDTMNIKYGFEMIIQGAYEDNFDIINGGLSDILAVFDRKILFETQDDFDEFFFSGSKYKI